MLLRSIKKLTSITPQKALQICFGVLTLILIANIATTHVAHAEGINLTALITDSLANFFYSLQTIASWFIYLAGALLNFSINLTMHIKEFVSATPAIYTVWKAIRDISGMFIIFALLYAAIMLITSYEKPNYGTLIKNIVVAGVLINFSFFITGLAIDVSNIVSMQLYNAIAPAQTLNGTLNTPSSVAKEVGKSVLGTYIERGKADGGLSTIFMQSLGITRLYNPDGSLSSAGHKVAEGDAGVWATSLKIILIGATSIIIMITAALSFFLASLAFIVRFVILIFLLAFSPILFASFVVPEIGKYATMWKTQLKNQLVFMPVYLLLMYFALSVLTSSSIFQGGYAGNLTSSGGFLGDLMVLALNAVLVIVMLNAPLLAAMSMGAMVPKWANNFTAESVWKKVGGYAQGGAKAAWQNTAGLAASRIANSEAMRASYAKNPGSARFVNSLFTKTASGYDKSQSADEKRAKEENKRIGKVDRAQYNSDDEYKKAKDEAEMYQATHRQTLTRQTILGRLVNTRGAKRAGFEMQSKADKQAKKKSKDTVLKDKGAAQKKLRELEDRIAENSREIGMRPGTPPTIAEMDEVARLKREIDGYDEKLKEIREIEETDRDDKLADRIAEKNKKDDGDGDKGKDNPKT